MLTITLSTPILLYRTGFPGSAAWNRTSPFDGSDVVDAAELLSRGGVAVLIVEADTIDRVGLPTEWDPKLAWEQLRERELDADTAWVVHSIGGGSDLRHRGCAPYCCERAGVPLAHLSPEDHGEWCWGCGERLDAEAPPMSFDRKLACEDHAAGEDHAS